MRKIWVARKTFSLEIFSYIYFYVSIVLVSKHYAMNMYREVKVKLFAAFTFALIGRFKLSVSRYSRLNLWKFLYVLLEYEYVDESATGRVLMHSMEQNGYCDISTN